MNTIISGRIVSQDLRQQLRKAYRAKRQALSQEQQQQAAIQLLKSAQSYDLLDKFDKIALYLPNDGEISPSEILQYAWQQKTLVYLPVLHPFNKGTLLFVEYHSDSEMRPNRFDIMEPVLECHRICPVEELDAIFTPLVAFDKKGNRMGMGGGFYDRTLACLTRMPESERPEIIGVAHDCQECPAIPIANWDIPLKSILTPTRLIQG
ncbi:5-formyltetrahydrofolate cyclo-ligase [Paraneptunicella aestuarii]|uniref:5-formyltetrahydrofolate cyclo-ligase n=1 Tax=Paraneptunicella aestuarii TaxID=2831148 RepID=UPI001E3D6627|nr:5-formyltetrahydrofolate cyclo-ligase [Paraneptunicella aestuarii]UAA39844.1 5-formyltetrahydrofolate cyclo-ligase [Paraneptunicella aestuarii]